MTLKRAFKTLLSSLDWNSNIPLILSIGGLSIGATLGRVYQGFMKSTDLRTIRQVSVLSVTLYSSLRAFLISYIVSKVMVTVAKIKPKRLIKIYGICLIYYVISGGIALSILITAVKLSGRIWEPEVPRKIFEFKAGLHDEKFRFIPEDFILDALRSVLPDNTLAAFTRLEVTHLTPPVAMQNDTHQEYTRSPYGELRDLNDPRTWRFDYTDLPLTNYLGLFVFSVSIGSVLQYQKHKLESSSSQLGSKHDLWSVVINVKNCPDSILKPAEACVVIFEDIVEFLSNAVPMVNILLIASEVAASDKKVYDSMMDFVKVSLICHGLYISILFILYSILLRRNPFALLHALRFGLATTLATGSLAVAVPLTIKGLDHCVNDHEVPTIVTLLGTVNAFEGVVFYEGLSLLYLNSIYEYPFSISSLMAYVLVLSIGSICYVPHAMVEGGRASKPNGIRKHSPVLIAAFGIFRLKPGNVLAFLSVDWILSRSRACSCFFRDSVGSVILDHYFKFI